MKVALVAACTNGKSRPPVARLGDVNAQVVPTGLTNDRFAKWVRLVSDMSSDTVPAAELYSGVAWSATLAASRALSEVSRCELWIMSAGFGLVREHDDLVPYSATFSPGKGDSVGRAGDDWVKANREWWSRLTRWVPDGIEAHRSLTALAEGVDALVFVMSPRYLDAAGDDALEAARSAPSAVVISGGIAPSHPLGPYSLVFDKRLREDSTVTGARRLVAASDMSLNQRVAEHLFETLGLDVFNHAAASDYLGMVMSQRKPARTFDYRQPATDEEVCSWIEEQLLTDSSLSKTRLLARWRGDGKKCEQKRFGLLYEQARRTVEMADRTPEESR